MSTEKVESGISEKSVYRFIYYGLAVYLVIFEYIAECINALQGIFAVSHINLK